MKNEKNMGIFNICIIVYNMMMALLNALEGYVSFVSIAILIFNLIISISALKNNSNNKFEKVCLVLEIITAFIIVLGIF